MLQVAVIQYSDTPRLEIPLGKHQGAAELIQAIKGISYMGGNTQVRQFHFTPLTTPLTHLSTPLHINENVYGIRFTYCTWNISA